MTPEGAGAEAPHYVVERVRDAIARAPDVNELDLRVPVVGGKVFIAGTVATPERREAITDIVGGLLPGYDVQNETDVLTLSNTDGINGEGGIRLAAVGDMHFGVESAGMMDPWLEQLSAEADVLVIAGDLTRCGDPEEARVAARELHSLPIPKVAVLGNHDYHSGKEHAVAERLEEGGIRVLEGSSVVLRVRSLALGIAGVKGFGGGFPGACGSDFGEPEMKAFITQTKHAAKRLEDALASLDGSVTARVALLHYAPVRGTLLGERPEIYPFLGSYLLAEPLDRLGVDLVIHGHAHAGVEKGVTPGGIPVRNVAQPVIRAPYRLYALG